MARGGFHHHNRSTSGGAGGGGGVSVASSSGQHHSHPHQPLPLGGRNNHSSEREVSANSTTTAVSGANGLLWNYTTTTSSSNNATAAADGNTTLALNTSTTANPSTTTTTRKGDVSQLLSRGYTGRYIGAILVPYGTISALSNDEIERDLLHINAYATAAARYHQIQYVAINRVNQPPNAVPPTTTSAASNGQGEKDGAVSADGTPAGIDGTGVVSVAVTPPPPPMPMIASTAVAVTGGPIASSSPFYPPPPPIHSMAMMLPVRIDPEEEKRTMALRKKIARAEMIREELEQQYDALCKHCAVTVHKLQSFSKHSAGTIRFLQGHVLQQSSLLAIQRARLQMVRDAMATIRVRDEAILEWRQNYAYQQYNPTGPQPPSTEELDRLGAIEDGCPLLTVWNELERVHLDKALTIAAKATTAVNNNNAAAAGSASSGPAVTATADGTKPNNATSSMDTKSEHKQDSGGGQDDSESNNNADGTDSDVVMKDATPNAPESSSSAVNLPLKLKKSRKRNSKTDDGSLADTASNISDDNNNNALMNDDTSSNNNHTRHKKHGKGKPGKASTTGTPDIPDDDANLMVWPCTVQPATARGMPILVSAMSLAPERTIAVSTANMFGSSNHSLLYTERFLPELHSSNRILLSKSTTGNTATNETTTLLRRSSTALGGDTDLEQQPPRLSPVPSLVVEDEHPARKDPMDIISFSHLPDHIVKLEEEAAALQNQLYHEEELNRDILAKTCKARVANDEWVAMMALIRQETESILHRHNILLESEEAVEANARLMLLEQKQLEEQLQNQQHEEEDDEEEDDDEEDDEEADEEVRQYANNGVIHGDGDDEDDEIEEDDDEEGEVDEDDEDMEEGEIEEDDHHHTDEEDDHHHADGDEGEIVGEDEDDEHDDDNDDDDAEEGEIVEDDYAGAVATSNEEDQTARNSAKNDSKAENVGTSRTEVDDDPDATAQAIAALTGFASIASDFAEAAAAKAVSSTPETTPAVIGNEPAATTLVRPLPVHHPHNDNDSDDEEEGYIDESKDDDNIHQESTTTGIKRDHTSINNTVADDDDDDEEEGEIKDDDDDDDDETGSPRIKRHKV